jgi:hypothetical protein
LLVLGLSHPYEEAKAKVTGRAVNDFIHYDFFHSSGKFRFFEGFQQPHYRQWDSSQGFEQRTDAAQAGVFTLSRLSIG